MGSFDPGAELGPRLRQVREQRGLSVRELARRIQCSPSLISQIERGLSAPSVGMLYALATELRTSLDFLFGAQGGQPGGVTVTAHGDGRVRADGPGGWPPTGHGIVQRAGTRRTIDLASGVRCERLTPGPDERVDFLEVIYEPSGHSTDARRPLRHNGREYGLITSGTLHASVGFDTFELGLGDSIAFDSAMPHLYWNATAADVHAIWAVMHQPGRAGAVLARGPTPGTPDGLRQARARGTTPGTLDGPCGKCWPGGRPRNPRWPSSRRLGRVPRLAGLAVRRPGR